MSLQRACTVFGFTGVFAFFAFPASAHRLDIAYLDVSQSTTTGLMLTVAVHPHQAFELVRGGRQIPFDLTKLATGSELISAYVADHVEAGTASGPCRFEPEAASVPATEFDADADGVTITAPLVCPDVDPQNLFVTSTLFLEGFPDQTSIVRLELPEGFAERGTLNRAERAMSLDLMELSSAPSIPVMADPSFFSIVFIIFLRSFILTHFFL